MQNVCKFVIFHSLKNVQQLSKPYFSSSTFVLFLSSFSNEASKVKTFDYLRNKYGFSDEVALKATKSLKYLSNPKKTDLVLHFLKEKGFSKAHIECAVKKLPMLLVSDVEGNLKVKFKTFQDLGFSPDDIVYIVSRDPWILWRSVENRIEPSIRSLVNVLGSFDDVVRLLKVTGLFLKYDLEKTVVPNIEFMKSCGIYQSRIVSFLFKFPRLFTNKPEKVEELASRIDGMGMDRKSNMFLIALRVMNSMSRENWEKKLRLFKDLGFSDCDIRNVFRRLPHAFSVSEKKIKDATEVLLSMCKNDISCIVNYPDLLLNSVEGRLKPRLKFLEILERKNLIKKRPSLITLCKLTEKNFQRIYVAPYSNKLGEEYMGKEIL